MRILYSSDKGLLKGTSPAPRIPYSSANQATKQAVQNAMLHSATSIDALRFATTAWKGVCGISSPAEHTAQAAPASQRTSHPAKFRAGEMH